MINMFRSLIFCSLIVIFSSGVLSQPFSVDRPMLLIESVEGGSVESKISLISFEEQNINVGVSEHLDFITFEKDNLQMQKGDEGSIDISVRTNGLDSGVYFGFITLDNGVFSEEIPFILEIQSSNPVFEVSSENSVLNGEVAINVYKLRGDEEGALIKYYILDGFNRFVWEDNEEVFLPNIGQSLKITRKINFNDYPQGKLFVAEVSNENKTSLALSSFLIEEEIYLSPFEEELSYFWIILVSALFLVLVFSFLILNNMRNKFLLEQSKNWKEKLSKLENVKFSSHAKKLRKLERQKRVLEEAYRKNYLRESSYNKAVKELSRQIAKIKKRL